MLGKLRLCVLLALISSPSISSAAPEEVARNGVFLFFQSCVLSSPSFAGAPELFEEAGLRRRDDGVWLSSDSSTRAFSTRNEGCMVDLQGANIHVVRRNLVDFLEAGFSGLWNPMERSEGFDREFAVILNTTAAHIAIFIRQGSSGAVGIFTVPAQ